MRVSSDNEIRKGSTPTLILAVLADGPRHGYAIAREIERRSDDALKMGEGALYPALRALERDGLLVSRWETMPSGPARRTYTLTPDGLAPGPILPRPSPRHPSAYCRADADRPPVGP